MKSTFRTVISLTAMAFGVSLTNYCSAAVVVTPGPPPPRMVVSPPPRVPMGFPDRYIWDGRQFVGVVGNQPYYLGPGNVWIPMDQPRLNRWRTWERSNPNWRTRATRNTRYRIMAPITQPMRTGPPPVVRPHQLPPPPVITPGPR